MVYGVACGSTDHEGKCEIPVERTRRLQKQRAAIDGVSLMSKTKAIPWTLLVILMSAPAFCQEKPNVVMILARKGESRLRFAEACMLRPVFALQVDSCQSTR